MKKLITFFAIFFLYSNAFAITPDQAKAFADNYKKAFEAKDGAALEALLYAKDVSPDELNFSKMFLKNNMGEKIIEIKWGGIPPEEITEITAIRPSMSGKMVKLPVTPIMKIVAIVDTSKVSTSRQTSSTRVLYVAEINGKLLIPVPVSVK